YGSPIARGGGGRRSRGGGRARVPRPGSPRRRHQARPARRAQARRPPRARGSRPRAVARPCAPNCAGGGLPARRSRLLAGHHAPPVAALWRAIRARRARARIRQSALLARSGERAAHHGRHPGGPRAAGPRRPWLLRAAALRFSRPPRHGTRTLAGRARSLPRNQDRGGTRELALLRPPLLSRDRRGGGADAPPPALSPPPPPP